MEKIKKLVMIHIDGVSIQTFKEINPRLSKKIGKYYKNLVSGGFLDSCDSDSPTCPIAEGKNPKDEVSPS